MFDKDIISMSDDDFKLVWNKVLLRPSEMTNDAEKIIWIKDSTIATVGNFSASTGKAKSKKTFNVCALAAAALKGGNVLMYNAKLPNDKNKILYVDTEQSRNQCRIVYKRILKMAGFAELPEHPNLQCIVLREELPESRRNTLCEILKRKKDYGLVIIDGIRDLIYDINSPTESGKIINMLMKLSSYYNIHIHVVLHLNKGDDNTRGHIGTELNNKAETVIQIKKSDNDANTSVVYPMYMRDKEFNPFAFKINAEGIPELNIIEINKGPKKCNYDELSIEQHKSSLEKCFNDGTINGYTNLVDSIKLAYIETGVSVGKNKCVSLIKYLTKCGAIFKRGKEYCYNENFTLN